MVKIRIPLGMYLKCVIGKHGGRCGEKKYIVKAKKELEKECGVDFGTVQDKVLNNEFKII